MSEDRDPPRGPSDPRGEPHARQDAAAAGSQQDGSDRRRSIASLLALATLLAVIVGALMLLRAVPDVTVQEESLEERAWATVQQELTAAFLVTGELIITTTTRVENTKTLLPGLLDVDLGTTSAQVRVPGRVLYGIFADSLTRDRIRVTDDSVIEITMPEPHVYAVEPDLSAMEVETQRGWARLSRETEQQVRQRAIALVERSLYAQGRTHLRRSVQPRVNTARALERMLRPALEAAGVENPEFRFRIGREITWESLPDR